MSTTSKPTLDLTSTDDEGYFEYAIEELTDMLDTINPHDTAYISHGENVGWKNTTGTVEVTIVDGLDLLRKLTPDGDWTLTATLRKEEGELALELSHHDSPTGELHVLTPE